MMELTQDVGWIAVIVGAVLAFFAGWPWYSPIGLGNPWAQSLGIDMGGQASCHAHDAAGPRCFCSAGLSLLRRRLAR